MSTLVYNVSISPKVITLNPYIYVSFVLKQCMCFSTYLISSVKRRSFFSFQNNPKDLDPSCKTDLDPCDCLGRVKLVL